jgi:hypothetical protein
MNAVVTVLVLAGLGQAEPAQIDIKFAQVAPVFRDAEPFQPSANQHRAVVLLQGLRPHPFSSRNIARAHWYGWQRPDSVLVNALAEEADVFALAYSQNDAVERIAESPRLHENIRLLKKTGYREIVLIGHSAGGLLARHLVEDYPELGVTKVVQVCSPNGGATWANARFGVREEQETFLGALTKNHRKNWLAQRAGKKIADDVEFVCVVGQVKLPEAVSVSAPLGDEGSVRITVRLDRFRGDGIVSAASQWPQDLRDQGIPALRLHTTHFTVMQSKSTAACLQELVRDKQTRWDAGQILEVERIVFGEQD